MHRNRSVLCSLALVACLGGCSRAPSTTEPRGDAPAVRNSGATDNRAASSHDEATSSPEKKSPLLHAFPQPLATTAAGWDLEAIAARRLHLESLISQYGERLLALDAGASLGEDTIRELRGLGPKGIVVTLAAPRASTEQISIGRNILLNELIRAIDTEESGRAYPDPMKLLEQLQPMLSDKSEAETTLLLYWMALSYPVGERDDHFRALGTLMRDSPHAMVRELAFVCRARSEGTSSQQYLRGLQQAISVPGMENALRPEYAAELLELGPNASATAIANIQEWKSESRFLLDREKKEQLARERRRQSPYLTPLASAYEDAAEFGRLQGIPRDIVLPEQIKDLESAIQGLQVGRGERLRTAAGTLGLSFDNTTRELDQLLAENVGLSMDVGRHYLRRGRSLAAQEAFNELFVFLTLGQSSPIGYARNVCGMLVVASASDDLDQFRKVTGDSVQLLNKAELGPFSIRTVASSAIQQILSDVLRRTGQTQDANELIAEIDERMKTQVDPTLDVALERYLIGAELWCDAAEFEIAQASLDKVAPSIDSLARREPRRAAQLLVGMGEAQLSRDRYADAITHLERAIVVAKSSELSDVVAEATALSAFAHAAAGDTTEATALLVSMSQAPKIGRSLATLATIDLTIGRLLLQEQDAKGAQPFLASAVAVLEQERPPSHFLSRRANALLNNGSLSPAPSEAPHSDRLTPQP